mmetsp:Transcript_25159/g.95089  ORF Transcript_25159/g.95089 Transcript_25159/m.95089 type:complete len:222 (-) Transcript_25159:1459-2124(-)
MRPGRTPAQPGRLAASLAARPAVTAGWRTPRSGRPSGHWWRLPPVMRRANRRVLPPLAAAAAAAWRPWLTVPNRFAQKARRGRYRPAHLCLLQERAPRHPPKPRRQTAAAGAHPALRASGACSRAARPPRPTQRLPYRRGWSPVGAGCPLFLWRSQPCRSFRRWPGKGPPASQWRARQLTATGQPSGAVCSERRSTNDGSSWGWPTPLVERVKQHLASQCH